MLRIFSITALILAVILNACGQTGLRDGLALKYLVQQPAEPSAHPPVVIFLHGYGSDEKDLMGLAKYFPGRYLIVSARAPYPLPGRGYEWYEMTEVNGQRDGNVNQLANSRALISKFIAQVVEKYNADAQHIYLVGFSQGAIMSYQVGLVMHGKVSGIAALSGMIYPSLKTLVSNDATLKKLRIFVSHGTADKRVPFSDGKAAADYLESMGLKPEYHEYAGMGHTISKKVIDDLVQWLK